MGGRLPRRFLVLLFFCCFAVVSIATNEDRNSTADKHSDRRGKALKISKRPCTDPNGQRGVCTFKWDCINGNGTLMGTCVDGFIFGTCCRYNNRSSSEEAPTPTPTPTPSHLPSHAAQDTEGIANDNEATPQSTSLTNNTTNEATRPNNTTSATRRPAHVISPTTPKPTVTTPTVSTVIGTSSPAGSHQLVTWTSIGPTKGPPQRPLVLHPFPFRPGTSHFPTLMQGGAWPMGVAFPVDPFQINRPLQVTHAQGTTLVTHAPAGNATHTSNNVTQGDVEMTTVSVPIPHWNTETEDEEATLTSGNFSSPAHPWSSTSSTGRPTRVPLDYRKDCGVRAIGAKARIVGGQSASFGRWPWQVLVKEAAWLGLYQKNKCGGVLVSSKYAITAGHCQPGRFLSALVVILGESDLLSDLERLKPEVRRVKRMIVHRHYNPQNFDNDIALLELDPPVHFRPHISPVCLPTPQEDFTGRRGYVTGWGKTSHGGVIPNLLQEVQVPIMSNAECLDMFQAAGHAKLIKDTFLCAGYRAGGKDSCEGDSGGPLVVERESGQWVLVGTVSHGIRCADPNLPGVYMRISAYRAWIDKIIVH